MNLKKSANYLTHVFEYIFKKLYITFNDNSSNLIFINNNQINSINANN